MKFAELLKSNKIVIVDGAMGTQLSQRGARAGAESNLKFPDVVVDVHRAYIEAGADAIISNTFCMNRIYMETNHIADDLEAINRAGVELALKASDGRVAVLGGIGPTGQMLAPMGTATEQQLYDAFLEQARVIAAAGADAFIIETMMDMNETVCAVRACKENFELPVIASLTYATALGGGRTTMGHRAADIAAALEKAGADVLSANCGVLDPAEVATIAAAYRSASKLPILVEPNAGKPRLDERDKAVYDMLPEDFAKGVAVCVEAGATLVGGCCGTSPAHINALAKAFKK